MWTFEQRITRICNKMIDSVMVEETNCKSIKRPLFHEKYKILISFTPKNIFWYKFDNILEDCKNIKKDYDILLNHNKNFINITLMCNDIEVIKKIYNMYKTKIDINFIHWIPETHWNVRKAVPEEKEKRRKWYNKYSFRITFISPVKIILEEEDFKKLSGEYFINPHYNRLSC